MSITGPFQLLLMAERKGRRVPPQREKRERERKKEVKLVPPPTVQYIIAVTWQSATTAIY